MNKWIKSANATIFGIALAALFLFVTIIAGNIDGLQWDLTTGNKFTLSEQTTKALEQITDPVEVRVYMTAKAKSVPQAKETIDLLEEYKRKNKLISITEIDPEREPTLTRNDGIISDFTILFKRGEKVQRVSYMDIFGNSNGVSYFAGEDAFTRAILQVGGQIQKTIYVLGGHGEVTTDYAGASAFFSKVSLAGFNLKDLNLIKTREIPADAAMLMILGPRVDLTEQETALILTYVQKNGKLFITSNVPENGKPLTYFNALLKLLGIVNQNAVVMDPTLYEDNNPFKIVPNIHGHPITDPIKAQGLQTSTEFNLAMISGDLASGWAADPLLYSSDNAFAKSDMTIFTRQLTPDDVTKTDKDLAGPFKLAFAVRSDKNIAKAVVFGSTMLLNYFDQYANRDLILNSIAWLDNYTGGLTIRPRENQIQEAVILPNEMNFIFFGTVVVFPLLILIIGGIVWWRRRKG